MGATELRVLSKTPYNAEPALAELVKHPITPLHLVYKRNHCKCYPVRFTGILTYRPLFWIAFIADIIDLRRTADTYTVQIDGNFKGLKEKSITYPDILHHFPRREVVATLVVRYPSNVR